MIIAILPTYPLRDSIPVLLGLLLVAAPARSQSVPVFSGGNIEGALIGAFNFGGSLSSVAARAVNGNADPIDIVTPSSNGSIGGQLAISLSRHLLIAIEGAYVAGSKVQFTQDYFLAPAPGGTATTQRTSVDARASTVDLNAEVQYRFVVRRMPRTVPYLILGGGVLRSSGDLTLAIIGDIPGKSSSGSFRTYHAAVHSGGGVRYYFTERAGFRVEARVYNSRDLNTFGRLGFGVFYEFR